MSIIRSRTRGKVFVEQRARLDRANRETLYAYAAFIDEDADYIMNQLIETVLERDREFASWRAEHPQSYAPPRVVRPTTRGRSAPGSESGNGVHKASHIQAVSARE